MDKLKELEIRFDDLEQRFKDIEQRFKEMEQRVSILEHSEVPTSQPDSDSILTKLADKFGKIGPQNIVIIALKINPRQTKEQLISIIEGWGTPIKKWFKTNHFKSRLLDNGLVIIVGKNDDAKDIFSLSEIKGNKLADELIQRYGS